MTITEFLEARIAEDEERARAAAPWATGSRHDGQPLDWSIHFDRWSPARVLAECATKRAILAHAVSIHDEIEGEWGVGHMVAKDGWQDNSATDIVRALAAVYKDHPDYRQEWAL